MSSLSVFKCTKPKAMFWLIQFSQGFFFLSVLSVSSGIYFFLKLTRRRHLKSFNIFGKNPVGSAKGPIKDLTCHFDPAPWLFHFLFRFFLALFMYSFIVICNKVFHIFFAHYYSLSSTTTLQKILFFSIMAFFQQPAQCTNNTTYLISRSRITAFNFLQLAREVWKKKNSSCAAAPVG